MLKLPTLVAVIIFLGLWPGNSPLLRAQVPQLPPPTAGALEQRPRELRPMVTLGNPIEKRPHPNVTLGNPTESRPRPRVRLGAPVPLFPTVQTDPLVSRELPTTKVATPSGQKELRGVAIVPLGPPTKSSDENLSSPLLSFKSSLASQQMENGQTDASLPPQVGQSSADQFPYPPAPLPPSTPPDASFNPLDALPPSMLEAAGVPESAGHEKQSSPRGISQGAESSLPSASEAANRFPTPAVADNVKKATGPYFFGVAGSNRPPSVDEHAWQAPYMDQAFSPQPFSELPSDPVSEASPYRGKFAVPTQRPWVELWRPLYTGGIYPPAKNWLGRYNLVMPHFMVYGDYRTGIAVNRNAKGDFNNWASRLNLDMDLEITATERLHAFMGPLDRNGDYTRLDFTDKVEFVNRTDIRLDNLFFEGDAGAIWGGLTDQDAPFDLPFSFGFLPLFYQNGIWANDNVIGAAMALPSKNSPLLKWSNYDATFFWASDQINSDAFKGDNNAAEFFGSAWFIEAYDGYIEADYAFVHDDVGGHRSYHNLSMAYTRRYFMRVSNSVRYITNFGQSLPSDERTADGHMLLLENSLISKAPNTLVPYLNVFYGQGRTQSLARANNAGGILNNTGINFETDGLTGYPTLDATGVNATGAALGINMLGADFQHQLIMEVAALSANGQANLRNAPGDQYAVGMRYQKPLSNAWIFRTDHMVGWRENAQELRGSRVELRWKF